MMLPSHLGCPLSLKTANMGNPGLLASLDGPPNCLGKQEPSMPKQNVVDDVARGLIYGEYSLLLGAGASIGATGGNGRPLPTGLGLRDALMKGI